MAQKKLNKKNILSFLRENKPLFKNQFNIDEIVLFGSYARDEATEKSDVDILIESPKKSFNSLVSLRKLLEKKFGTKVDIMYIDSVHPFIMRFLKEDMVYA